MTYSKIKILDNPSKQQVIQLLTNNIDKLTTMLTEVINNKQAWDFSKSTDFIESLMAYSAMNTQQLFNSYINLNNASQTTIKDDLDYWINSLVDSLVTNLVLTMVLIDLSKTETNNALYTSLYEILNINAPKDEPVLH